MRMTPSRKSPFAPCTSVILLLAVGSSTITLAQEESRKEPSAAEIIQKSKQVYAALSTYSDEGKVVNTITETRKTTWDFTIRLSHPNLYRIGWRCSNSCPAGPGPEPPRKNGWSFRSAGDGQVYELIGAKKRTYQLNAKMPEIPYTDQDSITIFNLFFNPLADVYSRVTYNRLPDEKVGEVDCYVLEGISQIPRRLTVPWAKWTLWIGKQDFLILQVRRADNFFGKISTSTETHTNIVLNQNLPQSEFVPASASVTPAKAIRFTQLQPPPHSQPGNSPS